jgi:hypothetical protein
MTAQPQEYWFARRFPLGDHRKAMAPVHWKGYAAAVVYMLALLAGGGAFVYFGVTDRLMLGVVIFTIVAIGAAFWFITTARIHGDPVRTVAEYYKDRQQSV